MEKTKKLANINGGVHVADTTADIKWIDGDTKKPQGNKVLLLSKYGMASIGSYQEGFHVAWSPLPKVPPELRQKMWALRNGGK